MSFRIFCMSIIAGCLCSTALSAEPIRINPYPQKASASAGAAEPEVFIEVHEDVIEPEFVMEEVQEVVVVVETSPVMAEPRQAPQTLAARPIEPVPSAYKIPQPGDSYFDSPSETVSVAEERIDINVAEEENKDAYVPPKKQEEVAVALPIEPLPKPISEKVEPAAGNLRMRMSDSFDDMVVNESFESSEAARGDISPPLVAQPVALVPVKEPAPVAEPENIAWFSAPELPKSRMAQPPVEERQQGLVKIAMNRDGTAITDELLSEQTPVGQKWKALEGANIRQVLEAWSREEGTALIWDSEDAFAVLQSFEARGPFHSAVKNLLDQYQGSEVRPVAVLHVDPESSEKTLVVRVLSGG